MPTPSNSSQPPAEEPALVARTAPSGSILRLSLFVLAAIAVIAIGRSQITLQQVVSREDQLRAFCDRQPVLAFSAAFLIYTAVTGLSLPAAAGLTLVTAWLFGFWPALVLVSFASTSGALLAFLASRWLLGQRLQQIYGSRVGQLQSAVERDGVQYLLMLRLMPLMPFFLVNLLMGLTGMRLTTFWWASQLGMLPGTAVFVAAGAATPTLRQFANEGVSGIVKPQLMLTFAVLGCMPLAIRLISRRVFRK